MCCVMEIKRRGTGGDGEDTRSLMSQGRSSTPGRRNGKRVKMDQTRKKRFWRIKIMPKLCILRRASSKKLLVWLRDSYVNMMMRLANLPIVGASGNVGSGSRPRQMEYDEKVLVEIYKSILMAQAQGKLVHGDIADKLPSQPAVVIPVSSVIM